ncbi:MAG: hypothetical protein DIU54_011770 [Acidobacteriota bacterium]|jgi:hypothetical protein|nr:MAG: hypothetical protein DIU54_04880 [Acidobacteriota bacterium]
MPTPAFVLTVPAEAPFRGLAGDAVRVWLCGRPESVDEAFVARVAEAAERIAPHGSEIEMVVTVGAGAIEVRLTCGGQTETLTHPAVPSR